MKTIVQLGTAVLIATMLVACRIEVPTLASGDASIYEGGRPARTWTLSPSQLETLSRWLSQRRSGWDASYVTYAPKFLLSLRATGGGHASINVMGSSEILNLPSGQYVQQFTDIDIASLLASIGAAS